MTVASQRLAPPEILGNLEALEQCQTLIGQLAEEHYTHKPEPYVKSSIGEHVRHILDVYHALKAGSDSGVIDYNFRRRGHAVEESRKQALVELKEVQTWLVDFDPARLSEPVKSVCETTLYEQRVCEMDSFWQRELVFAASHVIHHCAVIGVAMRLCRIDVDELVGVAPATSTYWRSQR